MPVVGYISTFAPYDGIQYLIRAVAHLRDRGRACTACLSATGPSGTRWRPRSTLSGCTTASPSRGSSPTTTSPRYYGLIDVFVVPRTNESVSNLVTPLKPYEAMATGRALVMAKTTALSEMATEGETARFFTPEDPESLADVLETLIEDPAQREALAHRGRAWVTEHRTWERNVELYEDIYRRLGAL